MQLADEEFEQRALAGAVRTDEACDPRAERGRKAVEAEDLAVPLRDARRLDDARHPDTTSTNLIRGQVARAAIAVATSRIARGQRRSVGAPRARKAPADPAR